MDRRLFILSAASGLAAPSGFCAPQDQPAVDGAPVPQAPSSNAVFDAWLADFIRRSRAAGWPADLLARELTGAVPDPQVVALDTRQPEFSRPAGDYIKGVVTDDRIATGKAKRQERQWLAGLEQRFGVPVEILIGVWAMESAFGAIQGDFDVIRSVATLAAAGRRRDFAEAQLYAALRMIATGEASRLQMKGSWAGAMGQTQFVPETYLTSAVDGDGDGKRDIWGSEQDALASAANLLAKAGWRRGESWHREMILPATFDFGLAEGPRNPPAWWIEHGARTADGAGYAEADRGAQAGLVLPSGAAGPAFLVFPNHLTIRRYNNSTSYALAVGLLADGIAGKPPPVTPWPIETGLSVIDRTGAQVALNTLGFNAGAADGIIGTGTRAALRAWQKAKGLPADGYLSVEVARRLQAEAAAAP